MKNNYSTEEREKLKQFQDINGWIKFIDYPPKKYTDILISDGSNIYIAHYAYEGRCYLQNGARNFGKPTHWQPTPILPK